MLFNHGAKGGVGRWPAARAGAWLLVFVLIGGCSHLPPSPAASVRPFSFEKDTLAYPNELVLEYHYAANGDWTKHPRHPKPTYALHCFVVTRTALQFFKHAKFDPAQPKADEATYAKLIGSVVSTSVRKTLSDDKKIIIPGYANLRAFSRSHENLLKHKCGSASESYLQRGNWRMIYPFPRRQQERIAQRLLEKLKANQPLAVHLVRFPSLTINHAILLFGARETEQSILFSAYDPNQPARPITLTFDRATRSFLLPASIYFPGGELNVYEIYHSWVY